MTHENEDRAANPQGQPLGTPRSRSEFEEQMARTNARSRELLGLTADKATELATGWGYQVRIVRQDGDWFVLTMDLQSRRINLEIENGLLVQAGAG